MPDYGRLNESDGGPLILPERRLAESGPQHWETIMNDWAGGSESRNYGIKRITDPQKLSELLWIIFSLSMVAAALLFYAWVRNQIISIGY